MTQPARLIREAFDVYERRLCDYLDILQETGVVSKDVRMGRFAIERGAESIYVDGSHLYGEVILQHEKSLPLDEEPPGRFRLVDSPELFCVKYSFTYCTRFGGELFRFDYHPEARCLGDPWREPLYHVQVYGQRVPRLPTPPMTLPDVLNLIEANFFWEERRQRQGL